MGNKLCRQAGICAMLVLALLISRDSGVPALEKGAESVVKLMSVNYTRETLLDAAEKSRTMAASATVKVENAVSAITGKTVYGQPMDSEFEGGRAQVYAVAGGQVISVGENEEIGKYVRIVHGNQAESLYGNLQDIKVTAPSNVKKGQIIGTYEKKEEKDFYFSLKEK